MPLGYKAEAVLKALLQSPLLILLNAAFCMAVSLRGEADSSSLEAEGAQMPVGSSLALDLIQVNAGGRAYKSGMAPVSPSMQCVISLTIQYFVVYLGLQIAKTYNQFAEKTPGSGVEKVFQGATSTVNFCPMLAILFIGVRMRAVQLGVTPQPWAQSWMFICTYSILGQTILALIGGFLIPAEEEHHGSHQDTRHGGRRSGGSSVMTGVVSLLQTLLMIGLYAGFTFVILSTFVITAKQGNGNCPDCPAYTAPVPPALECTINLTTQYFAVYLAINIVNIWNRIMNKGQKTQIEIILEDAKPTLAFCPMMAVLFIGARMRAIQIDPHGAPQPWAQSAFYLSTNAILVQTLMVLITGYLSGKGGQSEDKGGQPEGSPIAYLTTFIRYLALVALYFGAVTVLYSVLVIQTPDHLGGPSKTPPVSPAMLCVLNLTIQFFLVNLLLALCMSYNEIALGGQKNNAQEVLEGVLPTMALIPMLCILFIGARLRALELDPVNGSPQKWAQTCMFICSYAVLVQTLASLFLPFFTGELKDPDADLEEEDIDTGMMEKTEPMKLRNKYGQITCTFLKFAAMLCVYGGLTAIIISVLIIQPPPKGAR